VVGLSLEEAGGWPSILGKLFSGHDLDAAEAGAALAAILAGEAAASQVAAFVAALRTKRETTEEMVGLLGAMRAAAEPLELDPSLGSRVVDTCGTGGDRSHSINISTIAALVVAGAGIPVLKHGGRAASSSAGSADVLEALGVVVDLGADGVRRCLEAANIGFAFAPRFHRAMRHAAPIRRELGVATVFNFLGPLANPAHCRRQVLGVGDPAMAEKMLSVLLQTGALHVMVVFGEDGMDELTTTTSSRILEARVDRTGRTIRSAYTIDPGELGLAVATPEDLRGGDPVRNAELARVVLSGEEGPQRDIVVLNAAAGLVVSGVSEDIASGIRRARTAIDSGAAERALEALVRVSRDVAAERSN